jgi:pimeloyl-ACP methyl ester carboxylesterase
MTGVAALLAGDLALLVRRLERSGPPVLFVHGATFPSALAAGYRFHGRSWMDDLHFHGYDAWAFDFAGYGGSQRYAQMDADGNGPPLGRCDVAAHQLARVVEHVARTTDQARVSLVAHSWGSIPAALYAARHPERIAKLCLFGPIARRDGEAAAPPGAWRLVTIPQQLARFVEDVPPGHAPVLIEPELAQWGPAYLASDPAAAARTPQAVKIPSGPVADIGAAWSGALGWRPEDIRIPTLVVRGAWDHVTTGADADWLLSRIAHPQRRDVEVPKGTHLMHLEHSRDGLFAAVRAFLGERP